ncbi:gluconate 2-dehydrogenase subunit 3 family protein [Cohnella cholangitidis]|uniref:Gluconate 2-dehydrogenase subunit 3 family protein n=1 Tax=Cohnella cholangitidis TaxID=2598458 RepID=A0A7G5C6G2_9BACL|nr:gluconate 2-dehydrogenase subunit 3 family protein [Cohnella cholangitidis]QMV44796.1 gluconate 2-dehydrogenase subunit 3 family protein [Cohnella cholangitidis]
MPNYETRYPNFDVMREKEHWDQHTREIVTKRINTETFDTYRYFSSHESDTLLRLCAILLDDNRSPVISYVVQHFDSILQSGIGESQRKVGVPKQSDLIRSGLAWLDQACEERYGRKFVSLEEPVQEQAIQQVMNGDYTRKSNADPIPVKDWMDKMLSEAVAAYYSHPDIWSEIGYAGPAYPRGYVRSELGLTDPWEARSDGK